MFECTKLINLSTKQILWYFKHHMILPSPSVRDCFYIHLLGEVWSMGDHCDLFPLFRCWWSAYWCVSALCVLCGSQPGTRWHYMSDTSSVSPMMVCFSQSVVGSRRDQRWRVVHYKPCFFNGSKTRCRCYEERGREERGRGEGERGREGER